MKRKQFSSPGTTLRVDGVQGVAVFIVFIFLPSFMLCEAQIPDDCTKEILMIGILRRCTFCGVMFDCKLLWTNKGQKFSNNAIIQYIKVQSQSN